MQMLVRRLTSEHVSVSARLLDVGDGSSRQPVFTPSPAALTLLLILAPSRWRHYPRRRLGCAAPPFVAPRFGIFTAVATTDWCRA